MTDGGALHDGGPDGGTPDAGDLCASLGLHEFVLQPQQVDFGDVVVNTTANQSLAMTNCSGVDVSVAILASKGNDPQLFASCPLCWDRDRSEEW